MYEQAYSQRRQPVHRSGTILRTLMRDPRGFGVVAGRPGSRTRDRLSNPKQVLCNTVFPVIQPTPRAPAMGNTPGAAVVPSVVSRPARSRGAGGEGRAGPRKPAAR